MSKRTQKGGFSQRQANTAAGRQAAAQKAAMLRTLIMGVIVVIFIVFLAIFVRNWSVGQETEEQVAQQEEQPTAEAAEAAVAELIPIPTRDPNTSWIVIEGPRTLSQLEQTSRANFYRDLPPLIIDPERQYEAIIETSKGGMRFRLFADQAPITVNNFVSLALDGYYDLTPFHRVIDGFMAQGGDPTGTGTGGPGYRFQDEFHPNLNFDQSGLLAMANSGPDTNGSQFFITFAPTPHLNGKHTIFGEIVAGHEVLDQIRRRDPATDPEPGDDILWIYILESE